MCLANIHVVSGMDHQCWHADNAEDHIPQIVLFQSRKFWLVQRPCIDIIFASCKIDNHNTIPKYWKKIVKSFQDWNDETKTKFKEALQTEDLQSRLDNFTDTIFF